MAYSGTLLLLTALVSASSHAERTLSDDQLARCAVLERHIGKYIQSTAYYNNVLYDLMGFQLDLDASFLEYLKRVSGYDLQDPRDIRRFACSLSAARSRDDLSQVLHFKLAELDYLYTAVLAPIRDVGSVDRVVEIADIYYMLFAWADKSGYPVLPIRNLDEKETLKVYGRVTAAMKKDYVRRHVTGQPFPVNMSPEDALKLLKGARSYEELEDAMELNEDTLEDWAEWVENDPRSITAGLEDIKGTVGLLQAFDETGLLKLQ